MEKSVDDREGNPFISSAPIIPSDGVNCFSQGSRDNMLRRNAVGDRLLVDEDC